MKYIILLLISCSALAKNHPCDVIPNRFNLKNLNDISYLSKFMYYTETRPWYQFHCNGIICSREEFEAMCYVMRKATKTGIDPNLVGPERMP